MNATNQRTDEQTARSVLEAVRNGVSNSQAARDHGINEATVRRIRARAGQSNAPEPTVQYLDKKQGGFNWRDSIPVVEGIQKLRSDASWSQHSATVRVPGNDVIGIMCWGDQHIGAIGTDYKLFVELTDLILNTPNLFVAILGDVVEMAIKLRSVAEVCAQVLDPFMQQEFIESWINEIAPKVLWATWGNHESDRNEQASGTCPIKNILARKVPYFSGIGHVDVEVGSQAYKIATSHKFAGVTMADAGAGCKRYLRLEYPEGDAAVQGDCHRASLSVYNEGGNTRVALTGGTLNVKSGYAQRYFSLKTSTAFPVLALWPNKKQLVPFFNVQQFMDVLGDVNA